MRFVYWKEEVAHRTGAAVYIVFKASAVTQP